MTMLEWVCNFVGIVAIVVVMLWSFGDLGCPIHRRPSTDLDDAEREKFLRAYQYKQPQQKENGTCAQH